MEISNQQKIAISHNEGPALVLAVPGSGKTTVLLNRIIHLNNTFKIKADQILNLTFSKTQALDMKNRFLILDSGLKPVFSTIHAFCYSIIRLYINEYKLHFNLIEGSNELNKYKIINRICAQKFDRYLKKEDIDNFFTNYSFIKNNLIDYDNHKNPFFKTVSKEYDLFKEKHHLLDFDDMLTFAYKIVLSDDKILNLIRKQYKYIQLDEGQDASLLQFKILEVIAKPNNNLFIVADDDQSIYAFRGANPDYLLQIPSIYPNLKLLYLNVNYRSSKDIVKMSDYLIQKNKKRYIKKVESNSEQNLPITLAKVKNLKFQNKYILDYINKLPSGETVGILFRNNINAISIINSFINNNIEFTKRLNFKVEILNSIILDLKNIIILSKDLNNLDVFRNIYYKLNLYLTKKYINSLIPDKSIGIVKTIIFDSTIPEYQMNLLVEFSNSLNKISKFPLYEQIQEIFFNTGYTDFLKRHHENISIDLIKEILLDISKDFENIFKLEEFIKSLSKKEILKGISESNIFISTVHQSKGLEYDHVIITDLVDGEFPTYSDNEIHDEEERRLFYVAITRARKHLTLIIPKTRSNKKVKPSKFIKEIKN
ncbi:MAG: ATP-dependent helicase [Lagierella massiliensis]|nr:ATP-dependent helicase [Lagierella massiliensis]